MSAVIRLSYHIQAPANLLFDLARSIDVHKASTSQTREEAIAGKVTGLMELDDEVTWRAKHFGVWQTLSSRITQFDPPHHFRDSMVHGAFKRFDHDHFFYERPDGSATMEDVFNYSAPLGPLGWVAERLFLTIYMTRFLNERNLVVVDLAESGRWRDYLSE
jgi:ligand-binding SRPBCC domain-containing protein